MATYGYGKVPQEELDFQDIPHDTTSGALSAPEPQAPGHEALDLEDTEADGLHSGEKEQLTRKNMSRLTFEYYQQFFDVETMDVVNRMLGSIIPNPKRNYLEHVIRPTPDMYGPFWICATLTFTAAIAGNLSNYMAVVGKDYKFHYDFHKVTFAATAIFGYWLVVPLSVWGVLRWRGSLAGYTFIEIICVYGYSLAIFVPISILWVLPYSWLQWTLVAIGSTLSGSVLLITFWPAVKNDDKRVGAALMVLIMLLHAALAAGFVLYFFHYDQQTSGTGSSTIAYQNLTTVQQLHDIHEVSAVTEIQTTSLTSAALASTTVTSITLAAASNA